MSKVPEKIILDATAGSRMMWFQKSHPNTIYFDQRNEQHTLCDGRALHINPDLIGDFTSLPFENEQFYLIVFDPPHMVKLGQNSWMAQKYGVLLPTCETDLRAGFEECWRVLRPNGTLIFKWNDVQVPLSKVLGLFPQTPLFGHSSAKHGKTFWVTYFKFDQP